MSIKFIELLQVNKIYDKKRKCKLVSPQIKYLGFIVSKEGISINPMKVKDILEWLVPKNVSEVSGFLGITRRSHVFIRNYAVIAAFLIGLLKK